MLMLLSCSFLVITFGSLDAGWLWNPSFFRSLEPPPDNCSMPESLYQAVSRFALSRPSKIFLTILARSPLPVDLCPYLCLSDVNTTQTSKTPLAMDRGRRSVLSCDAK